MRTLLTLGLVLGLTVAGQSADAKKLTSKAKAAATKTAKKGTAVKTTSAKKTVTTKAKASKAAAPTATLPEKAPAPAAPLAPAATTSVAVAPEAPAAAKPSKWSLSFYSENTLNVDKVNDGQVGVQGGEPLYTYGYPKLNYKASDKVTFSLLQEFDADLGISETGTSKTTFYDTQFRLSHSGIADLPAGMKLNGQLRLYVPTSEGSQDAGQILYIRPLVTISKPMDKLTLSYNLMPRFYIQQFKTKDVKKDGVLQLNGDGTVKQTGNSNIRVHQWLGAEYAFNDTFTLAASYGIYQGWWHSDPSVGVREVKRVDGLTAELYTDINVAKWVSLSIGVQTEDPMGGAAATGVYGGAERVTDNVFDARVLEYKFAANFNVF